MNMKIIEFELLTQTQKISASTVIKLPWTTLFHTAFLAFAWQSSTSASVGYLYSSW